MMIKKISKLPENIKIVYLFNIAERGKLILEIISQCNVDQIGFEIFFMNGESGLNYKNQDEILSSRNLLCN